MTHNTFFNTLRNKHYLYTPTTIAIQWTWLLLRYTYFNVYIEIHILKIHWLQSKTFPKNECEEGVELLFACKTKSFRSSKISLKILLVFVGFIFVFKKKICFCFYIFLEKKISLRFILRQVQWTCFRWDLFIELLSVRYFVLYFVLFSYGATLIRYLLLCYFSFVLFII